jgi:hypothetical protein
MSAILIIALLLLTIIKKTYGQDTLYVKEKISYDLCFLNIDKFLPSIECHLVDFDKMRNWARRNDLSKEDVK